MNRKESLYQMLDKYTRQALLDNFLDFSNCCAHIVALDLSLDRSNVSRLMNQLFQEHRLIKIAGRPTLYLSLKALTDNYPYVSFPDKLNSEEDIRSYISRPSATISSYSGSTLDMIGGNVNGSLYAGILEILPALYYPFQEPQIITIRGEQGVGKHYFIHQLFQKGRQTGRFQNSQSILYTDGALLISNLTYELQKLEHNSYGIIAITITQYLPVDTLMFYVRQVNAHYNQTSGLPPLIALLIDRSLTDYSQYYQLSPFNAYFPPLAKRPVSEIAELILTLFQKECDRLAIQLQFPASLVQSLTTAHRRKNVHALKNDIVYLLSQALFHSDTLDSNTLIIRYAPSEASDPTADKDILEDGFPQLPDLITLTPGTPLDLQLLSADSSEDLAPVRKSGSLHSHTIEEILSSLPTEPGSYPVSSEAFSALQKALSTFLDTTVLSHDTVLCNYILHTTESVLNGTLDPDLLKSASDYAELSSSQNRKLRRIINLHSGKIQDANFQFLSRLISAAIQMTSAVRYPIIIIQHGSDLAEKYALILNRYYRRRMFFSRNFNAEEYGDNLDPFYRSLSRNVRLLNRGHGIFFFVDNSILGNLDSKIFRETQMLSFTTTTVSLAYMDEIVEIINSGRNHIISFSSDIINKKRQYKPYLNANSLSSKSGRLNDPHLNYIAGLFPALNTKRCFDLIYKLLERLCSDYNIQISNKLIIDFLFYGCCIMDRSMKADHIPDAAVLPVPAMPELLDTIIHACSYSDEFNASDFTDTDYRILYDCIYPYITG